MSLRVIRCAVAFALLLLFGASFAARAEVPIPGAPGQWVTDKASLLSPATVESVNARLRAYQRATGHQVLVYVAQTTGGVPIEDWAVRAFAKWKVGRKGLDDGLVLFIFKQDRTERIEVGYGLEARFPDVVASRIIRETITPALHAGDPDTAVTAGVGRILGAIGGETASAGTAAPNVVPSSEGDETSDSLPPAEVVLICLGLLVLLIIAVRHPWLAFYLATNIFGRGGGGFSSGGFSGGGFSGGGGMSGGGGASGRW